MKIGLLAMSGIRVCDPELLRVGLTLPGFVERSKTIASLPSLGLLTLAALTPREHEVVYLEVPDLPHPSEPLPSFDLVAISSYSAQIGEAYALADRYRQSGTPVVMGGPHVTALPREALEHADSVVVGEGEPVWPELLAQVASANLEPIYEARTRDYDLSDSPTPAFHLLDIDRYNRLTVQTSQGCPHRCEFCASSVLLTGRYSKKPIEKVLGEIDRILAMWPHPFLEFADDNALVDRAYWKALLPELRKRKVRWFAETDISVAEDEEVLDLMRESGCAQVLVGLESPVEAGLAGLELRSDWKRKRFSRYAEAIAAIQDHGISVNGCFIVGLDGHTPSIFEEIFDFVRRLELYEVQVTILTPFPGTPLYERLTREDRLLAPRDWAKCTLFDVSYRPTGMTPEELRQGFRDLVVRLYSAEFTKWRRDTFRRRLRRAARRRVAT